MAVAEALSEAGPSDAAGGWEVVLDGVIHGGEPGVRAAFEAFLGSRGATRAGPQNDSSSNGVPDRKVGRLSDSNPGLVQAVVEAERRTAIPAAPLGAFPAIFAQSVFGLGERFGNLF